MQTLKDFTAIISQLVGVCTGPESTSCTYMTNNCTCDSFSVDYRSLIVGVFTLELEFCSAKFKLTCS